MPCPICTAAMISKAVQGVAVLGAAKHVKDKSKNKIKKTKTKTKNRN